jgi:hypothetical protein
VIKQNIAEHMVTARTKATNLGFPGPTGTYGEVSMSSGALWRDHLSLCPCWGRRALWIGWKLSWWSPQGLHVTVTLDLLTPNICIKMSASSIGRPRWEA